MEPFYAISRRDDASEITCEFTRGQDFYAWRYMGAHPAYENGTPGYRFRCWAPHAVSVSIFGDFNCWNRTSHPLTRAAGGIWEGFIPDLTRYDSYQFSIVAADGRTLSKADPFAFHAETRPGTASKIYSLEGYSWGDATWLLRRMNTDWRRRPLNIYEMHLGSWRRGKGNRVLSYHEIAERLIPYMKKMGFTHVEFLPVCEHPLDDSWGYQCTGYFSVTSRFGTPFDFMYLVDQLHQAGIGVILDWVPAHFPKDSFGLYEFDGAPLYEYRDPRKQEHTGWGTRVFNYDRNEVRSFLFSSAMFWVEMFHADGLRVDAVASMLYLDYGRQPGGWTPNRYGGKENLEAVRFLRDLNQEMSATHPDVLVIAEESTSWSGVTQSTASGGLGFQLKWNMGWMNDILHYTQLDPYFRQFNHKDLTFSFLYTFSEQFLLPLSHDEMVHGKGSLLGRMPGTEQNRFAGVRALYGYMLSHPGKKLLFMGAELGQWSEWGFSRELDWHLLQYTPHQQLQRFFQEANACYRQEPTLWEEDFSWQGFEWLCADDACANTICFLRKDENGNCLLVVCNFSPIDRTGYRVGLPFPWTCREIFNTDREEFGGGGICNDTAIPAEPVPYHGKNWSFAIQLPPLSTLYFSLSYPDNPI